MPRTTHLIGLFGVLMATGCSSSSSGGGTTDAGTSQDTGIVDSCAPIEGSICGQPCQSGNSLGVGAFCNNITDCTQLPQAHLCASLGDPNAHFCTFRCSNPPEAGAEDGGDAGEEAGSGFPTSCGAGATCTCDNSGNCGCTPNMCLTGGGG
jgi:hypothetical protein